jgi:hypothetical protein
MHVAAENDKTGTFGGAGDVIAHSSMLFLTNLSS